ncbi:MAG TPA: DUF5916 domain-containing protein [Saprospiraceae bacterium]|nr:DUF5916 domain-containing protein [Saprospiraceae bacterium]
MISRLLGALIFQTIIAGSLLSQESGIEPNLTSAGIVRRQYHTQRLEEDAIKFDGLPDEAVWDKVEWSSDFTEREPDNGTIPSQQTSFKVLYDNKYLYLAYRAHDTAPDSIDTRLGRRDEFVGDWVEINIDSYHDLRSGFSFTFSVSGVKGDEFISNDGNNWDSNWNPVWDGATHIDSDGWSAEIKIPFSQLRYGNQDNPVWGIQVQRLLYRKEERSAWQHIPKNSSGWVSQFGELHGLNKLPTNKQIELAPYVLAQTEKFEAEEGNPFLDGSKNKISAGIDGKLSVTRDMILDFTINPDFGQVEADPGAVTLDGYEIFFEERRPFFMESRNVFDYRITGSQAGGGYDSDLLFYSRRIGGAPHAFPLLNDSEYADIPSFTSILGAAKFSGKTKDGLSIGILESITDPEMATIATGEDRREEIVEPLTNYFVGRVIKDFNQGNTIIGGIVTAVNRKNGLPSIHKSAYSGGFDFEHFWKNKWWFVKMNLIASRVEGSEDAILRTQRSFVHLLQRTDAGHLELDPNRTSLMGTGGTVKIGKYSGEIDKNGGVYKFETGVTWRSPQLELNDIGFLLAADEINHFAWGAYAIQQPFSIFNNAQFNYNHWARWDFGGRFLYSAFNINTHTWLKNHWRTGGGLTYNPLEISNNALRGTTSLRKPPGYGYNFYVQSDSRKKITYDAFVSGGAGFKQTVKYFSIGGGINFQPINSLRFSIGPSYERGERKQDQFVANVDYNGEMRSIVSFVNQKSFSLSTRLNYYIRPNLSLQYYGQPFIFRALYKNFAFVQSPLAKTIEERFHVFTPQEITLSGGAATIDENHDGLIDYSFSTPDFNFIQFRSNLVLRWEYVAGSEFFLVWSQGVVPNAFGDLDTPLVTSLFDNVFDKQPHNIFLVKFSYRFLN